MAPEPLRELGETGSGVVVGVAEILPSFLEDASPCRI